MLNLLRRRTAAILDATAFCDTCSEVCTPACRASERREQIRTRALTMGAPSVRL